MFSSQIGKKKKKKKKKRKKEHTRIATHSFDRRFCLKHPNVRDVCDIGQFLFWNSKVAWYLTAIMFLLNNTFIQVTTYSIHFRFSHFHFSKPDS